MVSDVSDAPLAWPDTASGSKLAEALAAFQADLPAVEKNRTGEVSGISKSGKPYSYTYKYADLADVSTAVLRRLGQHGLAFTSKPGTADGKFGLAYSLLHSSGEREDGFFELRDDPDTRNRDGSLSRSKITDEEAEAYGNMTAAQLAAHTALQKDAVKGSVPGTERLTAPDPDDQWADAPPGLRVPNPAPNRVGVIQAHFKRLGVTDREERLGFTADIIGRKVGSTSELTAAEGIEAVRMLGKCKDLAALNAAITTAANARTAAGGQPGGGGGE